MPRNKSTSKVKTAKLIKKNLVDNGLELKALNKMEKFKK